MKKLLLSSVSLLMFSVAILIFQVSCNKEAIAQVASYVLPAASNSSLGGVIVGDGLKVTENGTLSVDSAEGSVGSRNVLLIGTATGFFTCNYDGGNKTDIPITLPAGRNLNGTSAKLSPDGTKIFFEVYEGDTDTHFIYSANADGSSPSPVLTTTSDVYKVEGAY